ncbi:MAG: HD domain-containing protein [Gammaproteobacteria bacterium]|nr:HD domain-containing protein [Gammaproteobacteria bacterium]
MKNNIPDITDFLLEIDALKTINRRTYINSGSRLENSAEHSWQLALACWLFADCLDDDFDTEKLIKLALIHDLGEIDAGDTFLYAANRHHVSEDERKGIERLSIHPGNPIDPLLALWDEQEAGESKEARLLKVLDRLLPFLLNLANKGKTWQEHGIKKSQVQAAHAFIEKEMPDIHAWIKTALDNAVEQGWLIDG